MEENYDVIILDSKEKIKVFLVLICVTGVIGILFYDTIWFTFISLLVYRRCVSGYEKYLVSKRKSQLQLQFKDMLYSLTSSFATGRHMADGLKEAKVNLLEIYEDDSYIIEEIGLMIQKIEETGERDIDVLDCFSRRSNIEDIWNFTEVFRACRETGGDFVASMNKSAVIIGEKMKIENEIKIMVSQKKFEGRLITLIPIGIIVFLRFASPEYLNIMYTSIAGKLMMSTCLVLVILAYIWIERITSIEV